MAMKMYVEPKGYFPPETIEKLKKAFVEKEKAFKKAKAKAKSDKKTEKK